MANARRRCQRMGRDGAKARVITPTRELMEVGRSNVLTAAVTLDQAVTPEKVLRRKDAVDQPGIVVSCRVRARLEGDAAEFEINNTGWIERSLVNSDQVTWSWRVTPQVGGERKLLVEIKPVFLFPERRRGFVRRRSD